MVRRLLAVMLAFALPSVAEAQADPLENAALQRASEVEAVLKGTMQPADVFTEEFRKAVPDDRMAAINAGLVADNGAVVTVDDVTFRGNGSATFDVVFERARADAVIQVEPTEPFRVAGFRITAIHPLDDGIPRILEEIAALPGQTSLGVYELGEAGPRPILTHNPATELAIGSTLKLYVLSTLAHEIAAGRRHWDDVVRIDAISHPSGQMQAWPIGSPVTLHTLAAMMISISDNTATDVLIRLLGREAIETEMKRSGHADPSRNIPFLTTIESSTLKSGDPARVEAYRKADDKGQRKLLAEWADRLTIKDLDPARVSPNPNAIDLLEWFASPEDIARIFTRILDADEREAMDILAVNPGLTPALAPKWDYAGYKGGSEPGVLNVSWLLYKEPDNWIVVSASWNDSEKPVDQDKFFTILWRLIGLLGDANE